MRIDFELSGHGSLYLFRPSSRAARTWVEHLPSNGCGPVVVEHRYIGPIIGGATNGLVVTVMVGDVRPELTSEEFLALVILLVPLAYVARWVWRCLTRAR